MNLSQAVRTAKTIITANSPVLLVGTAVAGVVTTGILAAKAGYKARDIIADAEADSLAPVTLGEKIQLTWLCYAPAAVVGASTIASVVGVHTIHTKRHAALAGLYAVTSTKLDDYREKAEEMLGAKKTKELNDAVAQKAVDRDPVSNDGNHEVLMLENGKELCYDDWSGRYFYGSVPIIEKAFGEINLMLAESGDATLNDFYDYVGLPPIPIGLDFGWSGTRLEPRFGSTNTPDGRAAISFWFHESPKAARGK